MARYLQGIDIGDRVRVRKGRKTFQGILMPRNELADDEHLVIKLDSGYNIGIRVDQKTVIKLDKKTKPTSPKKEATIKILSYVTNLDVNYGGLRPVVLAK